MRWRSGFSGGFGLLLLACSRYPAGVVAAPVNQAVGSEVSLRVKELDEFASSNIGVLSFTFENLSDEFRHVEQVLVDVDEPSASKPAVALEGEDLRSWSASILRRNWERERSSEDALATLVLVGELTSLAAAVASRSPPSSALPAGLAFSLAQRRSSVTDNELPGAHVLAVPYALTPKLHDQRWIALRTAGARAACAQFVAIRVYVRELGWQVYSARFRDAWSGSEWQREACRAER
ncbi:MAG: hypothetical protein QM756_03940 [Polyangiaceae bacterium]